MSSSTPNQRFLFAEKPTGQPTSSTFKLEEVATPTIGAGQILVRLTHLSVDPYLRNQLEQMPVNTPMVSGVVGEVVESQSDKYAVGARVFLYGEWQRVQAVDVATAEKASQLSLIDSSAPPSTYLGINGMPGMTAFFGLREAGAFKKGDIVLVSGAAGAVGSLVGQLAKMWGAKLVIGTAGGPDKCKLLVDKFGFDVAIDYKQFDTQEKMVAELKRISPDGIDLYFDNTGGHVTDAFYDVARKFGRVALCGSISQYNERVNTPKIPNLFLKCIYTSVRIQGFIMSDYIAQWGDFYKEIPPLVQAGKLKYEETIIKGFEHTPEAFQGLFTGKNTGKMVVEV